MFPTRLSFMRVLLRNLDNADARVSRPYWSIDGEGFGEAVYTVCLPEGDVSLFAMTRPLDDEDRSDRVIATAWDAAFVLYDGQPDSAERQRLVENAPLQEAGRFTERDLVLSRANKSVRLFGQVVRDLRSGKKPDVDAIIKTGYLMRTTAVYGNGKFGLADFERIADRPILGGAFMAEMLAVWLIRGFTQDLVEHLGEASLSREVKRHFGVGNATGLGMAPYLVSHPSLVHSWFGTREKALEKAASVAFTPEKIGRLKVLGQRVARHLDEWEVADPDAMLEIKRIQDEWPLILEELAKKGVNGGHLLSVGTSFGMQELIAALLIEASPEVVDALAPEITAAKDHRLDPSMPVAQIKNALDNDWEWATSLDFHARENSERFWYVSEDKLEPRLGERFEEPGAELESPMDIARQVSELAIDLSGWQGTLPEFLLGHPRHRAAVERVQGKLVSPFSEIQDNLIGRNCRPIDMLRSKLAMFGAAKFDPKSDRWTRIALAQGAPLLDELGTSHVDDWWLAAMQ